MSDKKVTNFQLDKSLDRYIKPNVFDRIVKEIDASEVPAKYIDSIMVQYYDGSIVELSGEDISYPLPVNKNVSWNEMEESFKTMREVRVFISTDRLERDVNFLLKDYII